jgi:hypothetical protein
MSFELGLTLTSQNSNIAYVVNTSNVDALGVSYLIQGSQDPPMNTNLFSYGIRQLPSLDKSLNTSIFSNAKISSIL